MNLRSIFYSTYSILITISVVILASCNSNRIKPAYCLFENIKITDSVKFERYKKDVSSIVEKFNGRYIVAGKPRTLEGQWKPRSLVIIKFPSLKKANEWYNSKDYKKLKALRHASGEFNAIIIEEL